MSWIQKLYETYNNCQSTLGKETNDQNVPLLPICHTTQKAQVEIVLDGEGNFRRASVIPKNEARTIIPCTEASGGRTSGEAPHPLCDKLQYLAQDYLERTGGKKSYFGSYLQQLQEWCDSDYTDPKIEAVLAYVSKGRVIGDLIDHQVFVAGPDGKLLTSWDKKKDQVVPKIFEVTNSQEDAFIRWVVEIPDVLETKVWRDDTLWNKWIQFYLGVKEGKSLCYVTGDLSLAATQHLAKLRNDADKAKLISSNDNSGFTFRGRFMNAEQASGVCLEVSQKAHLALRWLISRQGYCQGDLAIVAWATSGVPIPQPTEASYSVMGTEDLPDGTKGSVYTAEEVALSLKKKLAGYSAQLGETADVVVMAVDSATPGRLAITYYRELKGSDFLERLEDWHTSCAWLHTYRMIESPVEGNRKAQKRVAPFIGAPAPADIAEAAYGRRLDDKLRKATVERILPCIVDGQRIPRDLVESTFRRACNRSGKGAWEWNKTLSIACALFRKYHRKENYSMTLDPNRRTKDYLFGRLLALAESLEEWALSVAKENRETNAARLMQRFAEHPSSTWRQIELSLRPYIARLGKQRSYKYLKMMDELHFRMTISCMTSG
jgi:CRISPR-associated protein Csd1